MTTQIITFFNKETQALVKHKYENVRTAIRAYDIKGTMEEADLNAIKEAVFAGLWRWPQIDIDINSQGGTSDYVDVSISEALTLLGHGFHYSNSTIELLRVVYIVNFSGSSDALTHSRGGGGAITFKGNISASTIELHYFSELKASQDLADNFKAQKDDALQYIVKILKENQQYI